MTDDNGRHNQDNITRQDNQLPKEIFDELFGDQSPEERQTNDDFSKHNGSSGSQDIEQLLAEDDQTAPADAEPGVSGASTSASSGARNGAATRRTSSPARTKLEGFLGRLTSKARTAASTATSKRPDRTRSSGGQPAGAAGSTRPSSLQELESRTKVSLRESSLPAIGKIGVGGLKGGVGKSSTAYGVAGALAYYTNMRVVCVDAEPNFGSIRLMMPHPIDASVVELARDADDLDGLSDLRHYIAQNEKMRLDAVLGPEHAYQLAAFEDLGEVYERVDQVLSRHYDIIVYDLGIGFRDPAIRKVLSLCNELLFVSDSEVIPNAMLKDGVRYIRNLGIDLQRTTLVINHRLPKEHESADTGKVQQAASKAFRRVTDIQYDDTMSQLVNRRAFHIESLQALTRCGILGTVSAALEGLMRSAGQGTAVTAAAGHPGAAGDDPDEDKRS